MKKHFVLILILIQSSIIVSQNLLGQLEVSSNKLNSFFSVFDSKNQKIRFITSDSKNLFSYDLDKDYNVLQIKKSTKKNKFNQILGASFDSINKSVVYLSNKSKNKFLSVQFSGEDKPALYEFTLLKDYEKYLQVINTENKFYLLSASKDVNNIYVYNFENGKPNRNLIDLSNVNFIDNSGEKIRITEQLVQKYPLKIFNNYNSNNLILLSEKRKMYVEKDKIFISFDNNPNFTQVLEINLNTYSASSFRIDKPLNKVRIKKISNSYINSDNIFAVVASKKNLHIRVSNIYSQKKIKEYSFTKNDQIDFKNSPIIINKGGYFNSYEETENVEKLFKNLGWFWNKIAINVQQNKNKYHLTIGSFSPINSRFSGSQLGTEFNSSPGENQDKIKSVKFECLFDSNFNILKDNSRNVNENINYYLQKEGSNLKSFILLNNNDINLIQVEDFYVLYFFDRTDKKIKFLKFQN